jgi:hypothetical protein
LKGAAGVQAGWRGRAHAPVQPLLLLLFRHLHLQRRALVNAELEAARKKTAEMFKFHLKYCPARYS